MGLRRWALPLAGAVIAALLSSSSARAGEEAPAAAPGAEAVAPAVVEAKDERLKLIVLQLKGATLPAEQTGMISGLLAVMLSEYEAFEVLSDADVRRLVELEGEKQAMGCEADASCLAEIAGAMGARLVVFGEVGKLGSRYLLNLNLHDSRDAKSVGRAALTAPSLDALVEGLPSAVESLVTPFLQAEGRPSKRKGTARVQAEAAPAATAPVPASPGEPPAPGDLGWLTGTGAVFAVVGFSGAAVIYALRFILALTSGAPPELLSHLRWPVAGPLIALFEPKAVSEEEGGSAGVAALLVGFFAAETLATLVGVGGGAAWGVGYFGDGPPLDAGGQAWRWGFVAGGAALAGGGLAWDLWMPTSTDRRLDAMDFVPVGLYAAGAASAATGLFLNPFAGGEE